MAARTSDLEAPLLADPGELDPAPGAEDGLGSRPIEVVAISGEWSAVESSGSDRFESLDLREQRRTRYAQLAREEQRVKACKQWKKAAEEAPRRSATTWSPPGQPGRRYASDNAYEIGLVKVLVFFLLDTWMNTLVLLYVAASGKLADAACLLPSQLLVMYIQSYLALMDSELEKRRSWIKASACRCLAFGYDVLVVIVCGGVCAYTVLIIERLALEGVPEKANRTPKGGPFQSVDWMFSKRSFIWGDVGSFDCLIRFMTGAPRVVCLLHMLQWKHISFQFWLYCSTLTLTVASMIQAIVLFDFKASAFIRREYNANYRWFRGCHWSSRFCELMLRAPLLVCFARSVQRELGLVAAAAALLLDYTISAIALSVISGASIKAFVLSLPLYLVDICRYVDEPGLVVPARRLSNFIGAQRALMLVVTAGLMFWCRKSWEADDRALVTCIAATLGLRLLLHRTAATFQPLDLHEAAKRGDVQALAQLLTEGYDTSRRQCTRLRETPLHVALAHGKLACAQLLVEDGADPHIPDAKGDNPLHYACRLGDPNIAMQLLGPLPEVGEDYAVRNVAQRNLDGQSPAEVLPLSTPLWLKERLRDLERQELRQYTMSQLKPLVNRCDAEDLANLFGLEWDRHEYSKMPGDVEKGRYTGLVSFLFSRSVGDQLARVLDGLRQDQDGFHIMSLKPVRALGAGGFGSVIKVVDKHTQKFYAMKLQAKDRATKCAVREAQALHASDHAFIVGLVHIFQTSGHYCIVMELCAENLNDRILRSGREGLHPSSAARYTACITLALEYLHGQEIVFRDLKPENVLVTEDSDSQKEGVAKLADFGLAGSMHHSEEERPKHGIDMALGGIPTPLEGTPAFMAAESFLRCATPVDLSAAEARLARARRLASRDWYGLGCCLLLMLLGETGGRKATAAGREVLLPFEGAALYNAIRRAREARRAPEEALHLTMKLTAPLEERAGLQELKACAWLLPALVAMQHEADAFDSSRSRRSRSQL